MSNWQAGTKQGTVSCFSMTAMVPSGKKTAAGSHNLYLPSEIITEILKRLPVKSLLRFQCVCKDWRNLLKSPPFITEHHHHSAHVNHLFICQIFDPNDGYMSLCFLRYDKETMESERLPKNMDVVQLIGSSNGMLCVRLFNNIAGPVSLLVLNPATTEVRRVPKSTNHDGEFSSSYFAFGYSAVVRDYKIVIFHKDNKPITFFKSTWADQVEVYSLRTNSWKQLELGVVKCVSILYSDVAVNGAISWLGTIEGKIRHRHTEIISFDLATEVFTRIPLPSSPSPAAAAAAAAAAAVANASTYMLAVCENKLALIQNFWPVIESIIVNIWVLEEEGSSSGANGNRWRWNKKYSMTPNTPSLSIISLWRDRLICQDNIDKEVLFTLTPNNEMNKFHNKLQEVHVCEMFFYAESLASLSDMYLE